MKKLVLILAAFLACVYAFAQGIGSAKDLQDFIAACNEGESLSPWSQGDTLIVLTADIDLGKVKKLPQVESFSGRFDGRGFRIKNWKAGAGLFKLIEEGGEVSNLTIDKSCSIKASNKGGEYYLGFIADVNQGTVRNCSNEGSISHRCAYATAPIFIGGLVGSNRYVIRECRNSGKISSEAIGEFKEETSLSVGGITGGGSGRVARSSVVVNCENTGEVSVAGDLFLTIVGGISGSSGRTNIKYCVNRGSVSGNMAVNEAAAKPGLLYAGGIAGMTKGDVLRCDNFGPVTAKGAIGANIAGIVGVPHNTLVMADCVNRGDVTALGEEASNAGGIAGSIRRPVHIRGCLNYGKIVFDGISSRSRSTAGGIVGSIATPETQTAGAYVRRCMNHGEVYAGAGGNKYESNNRNAIHAAGVVAYAGVRKGFRASIDDNFNDGKITVAGGRKGSIAGSAIGVSVTGSPLDDWARVLDKPGKGGSNVSGRVTTPDGKPLEGILVTDGRQYVKTDKHGEYSMKSDLSEARFVYLSIPAGYRVPLRAGVPQMHRRIPRYADAVSADFTLEPYEASKDYTVLMIADPQVKPFGFPNDYSMDVWHDTVAPDAEAYRASLSGEVFCINLGDLVYNEMYAWDDYLDGAAKINCATYNVIGNHDYDQFNLFDTNQGNIFFETYVGPEHYSFDMGDIHYMVVNTILYDRQDNQDKYHYGLEDRTLAWVEADLANVPKDKVIMVCAHNNLFKTPNKSPHGSHSVYGLHYNEYLALFSQYRKVYSWNGHSHTSFYYDYARHFGKDTNHGSPNIECISVTRATGALRFNAPIGPEGEPQGYMVVNVRGENVDWWYKGVGHGQDYQMKAYSPVRTGDGTVKVNVWNWSEGWSVPEWYENGVKVADMSSTPGIDPDYKALFDAYDNQTNRKYCTPSEECDIFSVTPSEGVTAGEIRVTDLFGNIYTQSVNW